MLKAEVFDDPGVRLNNRTLCTFKVKLKSCENALKL